LIICLLGNQEVFSFSSFLSVVPQEIHKSFPLTGLGEGTNTLTVTAYYSAHYTVPMSTGNGSSYKVISTGTSASSQVTFKTHLTPQISIIQLQNKTFTSSDAPLTFFVSKPFTGLKYSLDGQANVSISENTTLTGLSNGLHNVWVYAKVPIYNATLGYLPSVGYIGGYYYDWVSSHVRFTTNAMTPNITPIPSPSTAPSLSPVLGPTPSSSPSVPEFSAWVILLLALTMTLMSLLVTNKKRQSR
jgi:hypothetical protein